ncbi:hypothetical protein, partial [Pseudomonas savastanoi]|uniref:hypothetical protein n=1 Tax=Pseudomonas savastanoi TaxID=29438 RepID=UPI001C7E2952
ILLKRHPLRDANVASMSAKSFFHPSPTPKNGLKATFLYLFQILDAPLPYQAGTYLNCAML